MPTNYPTIATAVSATHLTTISTSNFWIYESTYNSAQLSTFQATSVSAIESAYNPA